MAITKTRQLAHNLPCDIVEFEEIFHGLNLNFLTDITLLAPTPFLSLFFFSAAASALVASCINKFQKKTEQLSGHNNAMGGGEQMMLFLTCLARFNFFSFSLVQVMLLPLRPLIPDLLKENPSLDLVYRVSAFCCFSSFFLRACRHWKEETNKMLSESVAMAWNGRQHHLISATCLSDAKS